MSDAFDQMKNMKNGYTTEAHTEEKTTDFKYSVPSEPEGNNIKNFVIFWGRKIIDFMAFLGIFFALAVFTLFFAAFINSFNEKDSYFGEATPILIFLFMIFVPLIILIITIISNYFIYLLIDIRDSLKELTKK